MKKLLPTITSLVLLLGACAGANPGVSASSGQTAGSYKATLRQQPIQPVGEGFVNGVNGFGFKSASLLYGDDKNLAFSPVSLELALAMTRTGAAGQTADEMKQALGLNGLSDEDIVGACRSLMWRANTGGMKCANSIWVDQSYPFCKEFLGGCTEDFMADAFPLVMPGAKDDINKWAGDNTNGRINDIIRDEQQLENSPLVLCNALYFLGNWEEPFKANNTHDGVFALRDGDVTVSFMNDERSADYYANDKFSMLSLPFRSKENEGKYAMAFLLPAEGKGLEDLLPSLNAESFPEALAGLKEQPVKIKLPKFEFSFSASFVDTLKSLGVAAAFGNADFSGMTGGPNDLYIDDVLHKCYIKVDELGAEAAAVTAVVMARDGAAPSDDIAEFLADRPFLFAIYSQEDGTIAFLGAVNDPTQE